MLPMSCYAAMQLLHRNKEDHVNGTNRQSDTPRNFRGLNGFLSLLADAKCRSLELKNSTYQQQFDATEDLPPLTRKSMPTSDVRIQNVAALTDS